MILKLLQTEKMLKEIRRQVKKYTRPARFAIAKQSSRVRSVHSRIDRSVTGSQSNLHRLRSGKNQDS